MKARRLAHFEPYLDQQIQELIKTINNNDDITALAVLETGSNENGYWRKWADGTLECRGRKDLGSVSTNSVWGTLYQSIYYNVIWPIQFTSLESVCLNLESASLAYMMACAGNATVTKSQSISIVRIDVKSEQIWINFHATGRWKE